MRIGAISFALSLGLLSSPAIADDLFDGFYVGATVGAAAGVFESDTGTTFFENANPSPRIFVSGNEIDNDSSGIAGDVFAGYGRMVWELYVGAEVLAGYNEGQAKSSGGIYAVTSFSGIRRLNADGPGSKVEPGITYGAAIRLGGLVDPNVLIYGRAGYLNTKYVFGADESNRQSGFLLGFGGKYAISDLIFLRGDYSYRHQGSFTARTSIAASATDTVESFGRTTFYEERFGLGFALRFGRDASREDAITDHSAAFDGLYMGVTGGRVGGGADEASRFEVGPNPAGGLLIGDNENDRAMFGFSGEAFIGYGRLIDRFYVGAEGLFGLANASHAENVLTQNPTVGPGVRSDNLRLRQEEYWGGAIRLGYLLGNNVLVYGRGGYVNAQFEFDDSAGGTGFFPPDIFFDTRNSKSNGLMLGMGGEFALLDFLTLRADYAFTSFEKIERVRTEDLFGNIVTTFDEIDPEMHRFGIGLAAHFN